jgi:hypothetical protein
LGFAEFDLVFKVLALVGMGFSFADADFHLNAAVFPIHSQVWERVAFEGGEAGELKDFLL